MVAHRLDLAAPRRLLHLAAGLVVSPKATHSVVLQARPPRDARAHPVWARSGLVTVCMADSQVKRLVETTSSAYIQESGGNDQATTIPMARASMARAMDPAGDTAVSMAVASAVVSHLVLATEATAVSAAQPSEALLDRWG